MSSLLVAAPPLTLLRVFTAWTPAPIPLLGTALTGSGYLAGLRRRGRRRSGQQWPRARTAVFLGGLVSVLLVTVTFVGVYAGTLFWDRALQNIVLLAVSPLLLALGAPLTVLRDALPPAQRARLGAVLHSRAARVVTFPVLVTLLLVVPLFALYLTPLYEQSLRHGWVATAAGIGLLTCGFGYFWIRLRIDPAPRADPYLITVAITFVEVVADGALGIVLWLGPLVAPSYYAEIARAWGPDVRIDQVIGAGVLWAGGDLAGLPFLGAVMARMSREDARDAERIDAEIDASEAPATAEADEQAPPSRLWWENDPQLTERLRRDGGG